MVPSAPDWSVICCSLIGLVAYNCSPLAAGGLHQTATVDLPGPASAARRSEATEENGELLHQIRNNYCTELRGKVLRVVHAYHAWCPALAVEKYYVVYIRRYALCFTGFARQKE